MKKEQRKKNKVKMTLLCSLLIVICSLAFTACSPKATPEQQAMEERLAELEAQLAAQETVQETQQQTLAEQAATLSQEQVVEMRKSGEMTPELEAAIMELHGSEWGIPEIDYNDPAYIAMMIAEDEAWRAQQGQIDQPPGGFHISDGTLEKYNPIGGVLHVDIPSTVTVIGPEAFHNSTIRSVYIPNSVTSIGEQAFNGCTSLASVRLGTITEANFHHNAFPSLGNLRDVYFAAGGGAGTYVTDNPGQNAVWRK